MKGEKVAAKLFFKIVEAYILMEIYNLDQECIFKQKDEYLNHIGRMNIYNLLFYIWDHNIAYKPIPKKQINE